MKRWLLSGWFVLLVGAASAQRAPVPFAGADEGTPSRAEYFTWINNVNAGSTEQQTLTNLAFFQWLKEEYGAQLDIYAWDVGQIDTGGSYGSMDSLTFRAHYPNGFAPIGSKAKSLGIALGLWAGPDGFGETTQEEQARTDMMVRLVRDDGIGLFKFDTYCTNLRPEKQDAFARMIALCREIDPRLVVLNHRVPLGKAAAYATTTLWEGAETYIDVWMSNRTTAPHHRAGALTRGLPPNLTRLVEDHGVCLSSCLDYWEDDVVLQAFNRSLLLSPELYGNPWFLRDDEYPRLARLFNLHHRYGPLLVHGMQLPEAAYGPNAVSRGDENTRLITLRNLTWNPVRYTVRLDSQIGLRDAGEVSVRQYHPTERDLGSFHAGAAVQIEVAPFRSCLLLATHKPIEEIGVSGCDYQVVRDMPDKAMQIDLLGLPGTSAEVRLIPGRTFAKATLDGKAANLLAHGRSLRVRFPGRPLNLPYHRKLADLAAAKVPEDAEALYEATCFAADSNALEIRQLTRSGPTNVSQVQAARTAFLTQTDFIRRSVWDRAMFDGDPATVFRRSEEHRNGDGPRAIDPALRIDCGAIVQVDRLRLTLRGDVTPHTVSYSSDLRSWHAIAARRDGNLVTIELPSATHARYFRVFPAPEEVAEVEGFSGGKKLDRSHWRGSNLFRSYATNPATAAWAATVTLPEAAKGSYLCIALNGRHGIEGAYAAIRVAGKPVGAPDRAISYQCNPWEHGVLQVDSNYTYYVPVTSDMIGKQIDVVALTLQSGRNEYRPEVWITAYPTPYVTHRLELE
jgi:hypothetical protein